MVCDEDHFGMTVAVLVFGMLLGVSISYNFGVLPEKTTTTYTLEDGTVLHNCGLASYNCGDTLYDCDENSTQYLCQINYKLTIEAKNCGG